MLIRALALSGILAASFAISLPVNAQDQQCQKVCTPQCDNPEPYHHANCLRSQTCTMQCTPKK